MKTYNDLAALGNDEKLRKDFILSAIKYNESTDEYRTATDAALYYRHLNPTIMHLIKFIRDAYGRSVQDIYSPNHKIPSRFYFYFIVQEIQYLLGNGVSFDNKDTKEKLGKNFDHAVAQIATGAKNGGQAFGFWNLDHLEVFTVGKNGGDPVFMPLYDEETGALRAGIRYWQLDANKPMRATLYEEDGYTEYAKPKGEDWKVINEKQSYVKIVKSSEASTEVVEIGENYPSLPIFPMFNTNHQSELIGSQFSLDAYDLMVSQLINNADKEIIYWILKNCGGMEDDETLQRFVQRIKVVGAAAVDGDAGVDAEPHVINPPIDATEAGIERLRKQLFDDFMALDVKEISGGAATATQIQAAYEPLNSKTDMFEYEVTDFIHRLLDFLGIDDEPTYTRSLIVNKAEEIQNVLQAAEYTSEEYTTKKVLTILGDIDSIEEVMGQRLNEDAARFKTAREEEETEE